MSTNVLHPRRSLRAFGVKSETAFGTDMSGTDTLIAFDHQDKPMELQLGDFLTDNQDANASFVTTRAVLASRQLEHSWKANATPSMIAMALACFADEYSVTGPTDSCYTHKFKLLTHGLAAQSGLADFISKNCHELNGNIISLITGVVINSLRLQIDRGAWIKAECGIVGGNTKGNSGKTFANLEAAHTPQPYFLYKDVTFVKGTYNYGTEVIGSTTALNAKTIGLDFNMVKKADAVKLFGSTTQKVDRVDPLGYEASLSAKFQLAATSDWYTDWESETETSLQVKLEGALAGATTKYTATFDIPKVRVRVAPNDNDNDRLIRNVEFEILGNPVGADDQSEFIAVTVIDKVANYRA